MSANLSQISLTNLQFQGNDVNSQMLRRMVTDLVSAEKAINLLIQFANAIPASSDEVPKHVLADSKGLGPDHSTSGLTAGQVLKAISANQAAFEQLKLSELAQFDLGEPAQNDVLQFVNGYWQATSVDHIGGSQGDNLGNGVAVYDANEGTTLVFRTLQGADFIGLTIRDGVIVIGVTSQDELLAAIGSYSETQMGLVPAPGSADGEHVLLDTGWGLLPASGTAVYFGTGDPVTLHNAGDLYFDTSVTPFQGWVQEPGTPSTPTLEASQTAAQFSSAASATFNVSTTTANKLLLVIGLEQTAVETVSSLSAAGLSFVREGGISASALSVKQTLEVWSADIPVGLRPLASLPVTITLSGVIDDATVTAFGILGAAPTIFDSAATALPAYVDGSVHNPMTVSGYGTSLANDLLLYICSAGIANNGGTPAGWTLYNQNNNPNAVRYCYTIVCSQAQTTVLSAQALTSPMPTTNPTAMALLALAGTPGPRWEKFGATGAASPLTTKGDLFGYTTAPARVAVGANGNVLTADSTAAAGISWQTLPPPPTVSFSWSISAQSSSHTLALADANLTDLRFTSASLSTCSIPSNASVRIPVGSLIKGRQVNTGQVQILAAAGVTLNVPMSFYPYTRARGAWFELIKVASDEWDLAGDLSASLPPYVPGPYDILTPTTAATGYDIVVPT